MIRYLQEEGLIVEVADPIADADEVFTSEGVTISSLEDLVRAPVLILAVSHDVYVAKGPMLITDLIEMPGILMDTKAALRSLSRDPALRYWSL